MRIEVEKARALELAQQEAFRLERQKQSNLERQIVACKLTAGMDGIVVHANDPKFARS